MLEVKRNRKKLLHLLVVLALLFGLCQYAAAAQDWQGIDEAVVEKIAKEHGREARRPVLDPGDGDLLLLAFLAAGACGGFVAGYYWRELFQKKE